MIKKITLTAILAILLFSTAPDNAYAQEKLFFQQCSEIKLSGVRHACIDNSYIFSKETLKNLSSSAVTLENEKVLIYFNGIANSVIAGGEINSLPLQKIGDEMWGVAINLPDSNKLRAKIRITSKDVNNKLKDHGEFEIVGADASPKYKENKSIEIRRFQIVSEYLQAPRNIFVWLPPGYSSGVKYPTIYIADGAFGLANPLSELIRSGEILPVIVVAIDACGSIDNTSRGYSCRGEEYLDLPESLFGKPLAYENHEKFVLKEVLPFIERNFSVSYQVKDRAIAGYSAGGDWAASFVVRNPGIFNAAIVMSPSISVYRTIRTKSDTQFYISAGFLEPHAIKAASCLAIGLLKSGTQVRVTKFPYGHSLDLWQASFLRDGVSWLKGGREFETEPIDMELKCRTFD